MTWVEKAKVKWSQLVTYKIPPFLRSYSVQEVPDAAKEMHNFAYNHLKSKFLLFKKNCLSFAA